MDVDRWTIIDALFEEAVDLAGREQSRYLDEHCEGDADLRREVERMLRAHDRAHDFLGGSAVESSVELIRDNLLDADRPERVGAYRIVEEIGRGGMGAVYAGERDDEHFDQRVAIKVLQQGLAMAEVHRRFLSERQILASLEHEHIARIYDGGMLEDGRPYFVMEYVDGLPIDKYCDDQDLNVRDRLELLRQVADTVRFAHHNLVVHRDLKPSNILVTPDGHVKLLDFGLAKVLEGDVSQGANITQTNSRWMTPEYAAPEQILGLPITTATDVYQLGIVAYELVAGARPFKGDGRSIFELEREICEVAATRPSQASRDSASTLMDPQRAERSRQLLGDVDSIIMKAIRKEPSQRYASAGEFSADLGRFLAGLPVHARQGSTAYRARKFIGRNRWRLGLAAVSMTILLVVTVAYFVQVNAARSDAEQAAVRASIERSKAERVATFLSGIFEAGDLEQSRGDTLTVFDLVDRGVEQLDDLRDEPAVQARLARVIGNVYHKLSKFEESEALLKRSADILRQAPDDESADLIETLEALFDLGISKGDFEAAESYAREGIDVAERRYGDGDPRVAGMINRLGNALYYQGDSLAAEAYRNALSLYRASDQPDSSRMAAILGNLGLIEQRNGRLAEAESYLRECIAILRRLEGTEVAVADATRNLAAVLRDRGMLDETEALYTEHVAMRRAISGDTSVSVSGALAFLGAFQDQIGEYEDAVQSHSESLEIMTRLYGPRHQYSAMAMNNLANAYRMLGRYDEALDLLEQSLEVRRSLYGEDHYRVAMTLRQLGNVMSDRGEEEAALRYYEQALAIRQDRFGLYDKQTANSLSDIASSLEELGRIDEALRVLEQARQVWAAIDDSDNGRSRTYYLLGRVLLKLGRLDESEEWLRRSVTERQVRFGEDHWLTAASISLLGECLAIQGRAEEAEKLLMQARFALTGTTSVPEERELRKALERLITYFERSGAADSASRYRAELERMGSKPG